MLGLVAARCKLLDMRPVFEALTSSLRPGTLFYGYQGGSSPFLQLCRVLSTRVFSSASDAFDFYRSRQMSGFLFPPGWCRHDGRDITDGAAASSYYFNTFHPGSTGESTMDRRVRVMSLEPVPETCVYPSVGPVATVARPHVCANPHAPAPRPLLVRPTRVQHPASIEATPRGRQQPPARVLLSYVAPPRPRAAPQFCPSSGLPSYLPLSSLAAAAVASATDHTADAVMDERIRRGNGESRSDGAGGHLFSSLAAAAVVSAADPTADAVMDEQLLERVISEARYRARSRGASVVTSRDFAASAARVAGWADPHASPAAEEPEHYDEVVEALAAMRARALPQSGEASQGPCPRVRVLVAGETSAVVARMFRQAGADVATCDLKPSEVNDIPHFQGDIAHIIDLGWDCIVGHPPCTYLANSGVVWLHRDPERWAHVLSNADTFRRIMRARAPFVAVENSKMHRYGRALVGAEPTQYVHPWQHGTGHTKPTALYLRNLPALRPTCRVEGRKHALARLPPSPDRSDRRSLTYLGIAAAMALQWMPILLEYVASQPLDRPSAAEMVKMAETPTEASCCLVFVRRVSPYQPSFDILTDDTIPLTFPTQPLSVESPLPSHSVSSWVRDNLLLPAAWQSTLTEALRYYPTGHDTHTVSRGTATSITHTWVVDVSRMGSHDTPYLRLPNARGSLSLHWVDASGVLPTPTATNAEAASFQTLITGILHAPAFHPTLDGSAVCSPYVDARTVAGVLPETRYPWLIDHPDLPPPAPSPRHIRRLWGRWSAWLPNESTDPNARPYRWTALPTTLSQQLDAATSPTTLPTVSESEMGNSTTTSAFDCPLAAAAVPERQRLLYEGLRRLWDREAPPPNMLTLGLGAGPNTPSDPSLKGLSREQLIDFYRARATKWVIEATPLIVAAAVEPQPNALSSLAALEVNWAAVEPQADDLEVALTPTSSSSKSNTNALYFSNLCFVRRAGTRKRADTRYSADCAVAPFGQAILDTGAGPSLCTHEFLQSLPADALVSRQHDAEVPSLRSADGSPLRTDGTADLTFEIDGVACRHRFVVVLGKPLLLFGNDFLGPRQSEVKLNSDGTGVAHFTSVSSTGATIQHSATLSNVPRHRTSTGLTAVADPTSSTGDSVSLVSLADRADPTTAPSSRSGPTTTPSDPADTTSEPLPAAALASEAIDDGCWKLETTEHLLYAHDPITIPARTTRAVRIRAPHDLADKHTTCFVDRLPQRDGLDNVPSVIPCPVRIEEDGFVVIRIANRGRRPLTLPASSPIAMLDSEYYIRGTVDPEAARAAAKGDVDHYALLTPEEKSLVDTVVIDPDERLSKEQRERVRQLVSRHVSAFALDPKNPSKTHLMEVELPLKPGAQPHRHSPSRLGEKGREIVEKHIEEMESRGIIRKSNSAWGSRVVLVGKKDGSIRFCVDYRDTNSKLQTQDSPLPLTVDAIDRLSSGQGPQSSLFLSTLDLAAGFWCLPIKEEDKPVTAFTTARGKYEFNYLPFGIQSGPSYMCRLMDAALDGLAWESCMPYLDDVGVWSTGVGHTSDERERSSFEQMLSRLEAVFERLKWAGLSMKASKCVLFATSAEYLGHVISRAGLKMDPKKISAVKDIDPTSITSVDKVRSFLGLCSYYRRFISGFSKIAACLHDLTKDGVDVATLSQSELCQTAIKKLITSITSEPVLATPRYDRPFIVKTDAANTEGIGGVLSQLDDEGLERVIAYYGRKLNKHERNYTVTEIELLAALESIKAWRSYLWGRQFKLVVDHSALRWLHTMRDTMDGGPASRLMRWILRLQEYDFTVEHKPGTLHKDADGVSRLVAYVAAHITLPELLAAYGGHQAVSDACTDGTLLPEHRPRSGASPSSAPWVVVAPVIRAAVSTARRVQADQRVARDKSSITAEYLQPGTPSINVLRDEQAADPECIAIRRYLDVGHAGDVGDRGELTQAVWIAREVGHDGAHPRMFVADGVLYRRLGIREVPFVPASMRHALTQAFHDRLGHPSASRTAALIKARYYWPGLQQWCRDHVQDCHECTLAARPSARPRQPVGPTLGYYPFDVLYADIVSMAKTHDFDAATGSGASKLVVFIDSLSRWVEAIAVHKDPTSEQILDIFMTHVVSRHGVPRRVITDQGSNLASRLCQLVMQKTGVDLSQSAAEHHEAVGLVERVQQTLVGMTRAANEGGSHWVDHLPFLLMSYRATPHRVTRMSPAMLLYGRELRLPAQMNDPGSVAEWTCSDDTYEYANRLHSSLVYAWRAAREYSRAGQGSSVSDTVLHSAAPPQYAVGDRVARRLYDNANKLEYTYSGPYRVEAVLGNGRYKLTDLENNHIVSEFDSSNLRPYRCHVDADELCSDEYIVEGVLKRRLVGGRRQYLVKWRGYPRSQSTWEPYTELERRCAELVARFDAEHPIRQQPARPARITHAADGPQQPPLIQVDPSSVPSHLPHVARFARGTWSYGRNVTTPRGIQLRWIPSSNYTSTELSSDHFSSLRVAAASALDSVPVVAACLRTAAAFTVDQCPADHLLSRVWFVRQGSDGVPRLLSFTRQEHCYRRCSLVGPSVPLTFDTFGGGMSLQDDRQRHRCALRHCLAEFSVPKPWMENLSLELASYPNGHSSVPDLVSSANPRPPVALWIIFVPPEAAHRAVRLASPASSHGIVTESIKWRPYAEILDSYEQSPSLVPYAAALRALITECEMLTHNDGPPQPNA